MTDSTGYDYVIVGGGTAGLVLANRLSEDANTSVAVIEAGGQAEADPRVAIPGMWMANLFSENDWGTVTIPQKGLNNRRIGQNSGKMMGGSSSLNAQAVIPPSAADLDAWERIGNEGWGWKTIEPYVSKPFSITLPDEETTKHLNVSWVGKLASNGKGPVKASFTDTKENPIGKAWVETLEGLGHPLTASPFSGHSTGPYNCASSVNPETKTRSSSSVSYYLPVADRTNLKVYLRGTAEKVVLERSYLEELKATGVQIVQDGTKATVRAKKEVILSAGVFNSPKILELSGIGDPEVLKQHGIEVQAANHYVGSNLQDHLIGGISFEAADGVFTGDNMIREDPTTLQFVKDLYQNHKAGPLATPGVTAFAYLPTVDFAKNSDELHKALASLSDATSDHPLDQARSDILRNLLEKGDEGTGQLCLLAAQIAPAGTDTTLAGKPTGPPQAGNFISILAALSHPLSVGTVHISSPDPSALPTVDHAYLTQPLDLELHARHLRYLENIAAAAPFSSLLKPGGKRNDPATLINGDLDKAKELAKSASQSNWHSCGTCAMAPRDKGGVVDASLRVYGVKGLRIVDASVFPFVPQSNTQSLVYAVAERASDIIKGNL